MKTVPTESARAADSRRWDRFASSVALWPRSGLHGDRFRGTATGRHVCLLAGASPVLAPPVVWQSGTAWKSRLDVAWSDGAVIDGGGAPGTHWMCPQRSIFLRVSTFCSDVYGISECTIVMGIGEKDIVLQE